MARYAIEAALFEIPLPICNRFSHNFWILRDVDTDKVIAELHGLATSRRTGKILPIGFSKHHCLLAYHFVHDQSISVGPASPKKFTLPIYRSQIIAVGKDVIKIWQAAVYALEAINKLDLNYPSWGFKIPLKRTINSNSIYHTFADLMNIYAYRFPGYFQIGLENTLISALYNIGMESKANN